MLLKLLLLLTVTPLVELILLIKISQWTSLTATVILILATGFVGAILTRMEGLRVMEKLRSRIEEGELPTDSLLDGAMVLVAGALLITPGILTDAVGFSLLCPLSRAVYRKLLKRWIQSKIQDGQIQAYKNMGFGPIQQEPPPGAPPVEESDQ